MELSRLTATEARVAGLVASGRSNAEIADALGLRPTTVEGHIAGACALLGLRSRTELALFLDAATSTVGSHEKEGS